MIPNKEHTMTLSLIYCDDSHLAEDSRYVAAINDGIFMGNVVSGGSLAEVFAKLGKSIQVLDEYRKK